METQVKKELSEQDHQLILKQIQELDRFADDLKTTSEDAEKVYAQVADMLIEAGRRIYSVMGMDIGLTHDLIQNKLIQFENDALFAAMLMILDELDKAEKKHPEWPEDVRLRAAIVSEEAGELTKACNKIMGYGPSGVDSYLVNREATQVAVTAIRFLLSTKKA